jgi:ADP-ribose pyrophosphatase
LSQASPSKSDELKDKSVDAAISAPELLGKGFRTYLRFHYTLPGEDPAHPHTHDLIRFGHIVAVLPVDLARDEVVLIRQFRLPAHVANGRGDMVEIVAGHVEAGEQRAEAARRECLEEIGVAPRALAELFTYLPTPGASDEQITLFVGLVDAAQVPDRAGMAVEREQTHPFRVPIDVAVASLAGGAMQNGLLVMALQWLALNRGRLKEIVGAGVS